MDDLFAGENQNDIVLNRMIQLFNNARDSMQSDEFSISNIFDAPNKKDIVRLNQKAKTFVEANNWLTPPQASEHIEGWKSHTLNQSIDPLTRQANSQKIVLSLFDLSGTWSQPWVEAGYQVYRFDIQDDPFYGDINNFNVEFFNDLFANFEGQEIYAILAACPCTDFAGSGARHFAAKDLDGRTEASIELVYQTLRTIEYFKPAIWAIENPVGRIEKLTGLTPWRLSFDPFHFGDTYTKKTLLWGRFNADLPIAPVEPVQGSKMHRLYGGKSLATKNARSVTPIGFAYSFFMANNAHDHQLMAFANKYDRLDPELLALALSWGYTEYEISSAIDDAYYDRDDLTAIEEILALGQCKGFDIPLNLIAA